MKTFFRQLLAASAVGLGLLSGSVAFATPTISFVTPTSGTTIASNESPSTIPVTVNAAATAGASISSVQFFDNGSSIGVAAGTSPFTIQWTPTTAGTHTLTATVTDTTSTNNSATVSSIVTVNVAHAALLTTTAGTSSVAQDSEIFLRATAALSDAIIDRVEFFLDGSATPIPNTTRTQAPYNSAIVLSAANGFTVGSHTVVAKATGTDGTTTATSAPVTVTIAPPVSGNQPPVVTITSPATNATVSLSANVTVTATATDSDGFIPSTAGAGVTFLVDGDPITPATGETNPDLVAPYSITWRPTVAKTYSLRAQTIDNSNNIVLSPAVTVTASTIAPTVNLTVVSTAVVGSNVTFTATGTPGSGATVTQVEFLVDGAVLSTDTTSPYSATYLAADIGAHVVTARITDSNGTVVTSTPRTLNVTAVPGPTVSLTASASGTVGTSTNITAAATVGGTNTITGVQFFANGVSIGTDTTAPYALAWTPTVAGAASITAVITDSTGATATSAPITITVNPAGSSTNMTVTLTLTGATTIPAGSTRVLTATPNPTTNIDRIELLYDGSVVASDTTAPYNFLFTAPDIPGLHSLQARVVDLNGASAVSTQQIITIGSVSGSAPLIAVNTPTANSFLAPNVVTPITGTASDPEGAVTSVQVYVNSTLLGNATVSGTGWSLNWTPTTPGVYVITAIANDASGNSVAAPTLGVTVGDATAPNLTLSLSPSVGGQAASSTLPSGAVRNVVANATASSGRAIVRVEFFVDGTKVGEDTSFPYTYRYVAPALGEGELSRTFVLSARATDNAGAARDLQIPLLVVTPIGAPPTVNLLTPANGANVFPGAAVSLAATAVGNGGPITSVQFFVNGNPAGINGGNAITNAPYTTSFVPTAPGTYTIDAIATDDRGNTTVSNSATITAAFATPTVTITSPNPNTTARATPNVPLNLAATATVQTGTGAAILLVEFLLDGVQIGADTTAPYTFSWTPNASQLGQHVLTARVTDTNSQTSTSAPVNVNVATAVGTPPTITISTTPIPAQGLQTLSQVNFIANAFANGTNSTLSSVEFFLNDTSIGTATREQSTNLYRLAYDFSRFDFTTLTINENTGRFTVPLYAIARDSNNNQTVSTTTNLTITPSTSAPPTFTQPVQNITGTTTITQGQQFIAGVFTADTDGTVTLLQLYANGQLVASQSNPAPAQAIFYTANTPGRFNMVVVATDDTGNTAVSSPAIVINVTAVSAPTTTITRPADNSTVTTVGAPVFLEGTAVNNDTNQVPTLSFIAVGQGGARQTIPATRVGTTTTYRAIWTPTTPDTFTVTTQANIGATTQGTSTASRRVVVTNLQGLAPTVTISVPGTATTASQSNFTANASDSDGSVVEVEFFVNRNSIGFATRDELANTWRITGSFAGLPLGNTEVVALARDSSGNVAASPTSTLNVTAASSIAPSITIEPSTTNAAFNRQVQLRANARDTDGTVTSVQYFANGTSLGTSTNAGTNYQVNWTPNQSGVFNVWAVATDNTGITTVAPTVRVAVRRNNPIQEDAAFILQTYQDIANTTSINPIVFDNLDAQLGAGSIARADIVASLVNEPGFAAPVQLLAAYYVLMGQWPTPANYNALIATARGSLPNAIGNILSSNEYFAKYGIVPTVALLNNPASAIPADTFINRLWQAAGLGTPSAQANVAFRSNNTLLPTLGRGYGPIGLNQALAEFITNTNSTNTALYNRARAAALYYQLLRPQITVSVDQITERVNALVALGDVKAMADSLVKDTLYRYRYVTITKHPTSLTVAPRSGVLFSVEADGAPPLAYQWLLNGAPIAGATNALLSLTNVDTTRVGTYTAVVTSTAGTSTSDPATLTLSSTPTRLANISTRGVTSGGANVLIGGFVVSGANAQQTRQMLIRVVGPRLGQAPFNVTGVLADPRIEVYSSRDPNTPILTNDNWGTQAGGNAQVTAIQQATNRAGAFALGANSNDSAILATLPPGLYTVQAKGPAANPNASGVVLIEVYDVTQGNAAGPKAANVSTRGNVGTGSNVLIAGFVVNGGVSRRMLIRGAGPTLANLGVTGVLSDPQITLVHQDTGETVRTNDNWASGDDAAVIAAAASTAGAFPFANGSRDAAMIVMLPPGAYTVQLSGVGNATGVGIVEVYDVDP